MQQGGYQFGDFSKDTWMGDALYAFTNIYSTLKPAPVLNVDQRTMQPGEAQTGSLYVQGQDQPKGGVSPLVVGAAAAGTLLVGIVLVKVLD